MSRCSAGCPRRTPCPGPLSAEEDAVYQFVTMIARGYLGQPVWNTGSPTAAAPVG